MSVNSYKELAEHYGHRVVVAKYGGTNIVIECEDCNVILTEFNKFKKGEEMDQRAKVLISVEGGVASVCGNHDELNVTYIDYDNDPDAVVPEDFKNLPLIV